MNSEFQQSFLAKQTTNTKTCSSDDLNLSQLVPPLERLLSTPSRQVSDVIEPERAHNQQPLLLSGRPKFTSPNTRAQLFTY